MRIAKTRIRSRNVTVLVLGVGLLLGSADRARAGGPLNPLDFASLGAFPTELGPYTINTSGTPTLTEPDGTTISGVVYNGIAVFDFDSINIPAQTSGPPLMFTAIGSLPLALLSRTDATIGGDINGSGQGTLMNGPPGSPPLCPRRPRRRPRAGFAFHFRQWWVGVVFAFP
jgi:hypothetical protein